MTTITRRGFLDRLAGASAGAVLAPAATRIARAAPPPAPTVAPPDDEAGWERLRSEFLPSSRMISVNAANMSPAPRAVIEALEDGTRRVDADVSYQNRARFNQIREDARSAIAGMVGSSPDEIAIVRNASEANNIIVGGLDLRAGDEVLIWDQNHPTNQVAWEVRGARQGFSVRRLALPAKPRSAEELLDRFTAAVSPRTRVIAFSHVSNVSGLKLPAEALCRWARHRGIYSHVDGAQTFGAMRIDLPAMGCDSFAVSGQKWLMGPREVGFLYLRQDRLREVWPGVVGVGWGNGVEPTAVGARKFEAMGQRDDAVFAGLQAALAWHQRVGPERIVARVDQLAARLIEGLERLGKPLVTPRETDLRLGVVVAALAADPAAALHDRLYRNHGVIASPTGGIRFSPTVSATSADIDRVLEAVAAEWR